MEKGGTFYEKHKERQSSRKRKKRPFQAVSECLRGTCPTEAPEAPCARCEYAGKRSNRSPATTVVWMSTAEEGQGRPGWTDTAGEPDKTQEEPESPSLVACVESEAVLAHGLTPSAVPRQRPGNSRRGSKGPLPPPLPRPRWRNPRHRCGLQEPRSCTLPAIVPQPQRKAPRKPLF